ncbi:MAG: retroviral-like aspartic protease family protein, partial [Chloroflexi bacterium]|nr:retroviral-like aspartic protease family protein [Chloroflexota bacterium]
MGTFSVQIRVEGPSGQMRMVDALVDTGATHTLLPADLLDQIGVQPIDRVEFQLADERVVQYGVGEARIRLDCRERMSVVIFGPRGAAALLGATTLELFN